MANLQVVENSETAAAASPSQQAVANANKTVTITDERGRKIVLKRPGVLAQYRLIEVLGAEAAANTTYVNMVLPLIFVAKIEGEDVLQPVRKAEIDALIKQLDDDGVAAVMEGVQRHFAAPNPDGDRDAVKK
jgi:hypothetical protein